MSAPTTPIQLRATWLPVSTEALFSEGSSGEYEASARKRRSAETHNRNPISSFSRRLPVGVKMLVRKRMWAVVPTDINDPVAQIGQSLIIMPRSRRGGNGGIGEGCSVGFPVDHVPDGPEGHGFRGCGKTHLYFVRDEIQGGMRGNQDEQEEVFSYIPLEKRVPQGHPLRRVREMTDRALQELSSWFDSLYAQTGRPSIPPEQLLRAQILQALYTIRSERQLMDQIDGNWRYRWFVGLKLDDEVWDVTVFTKNRDRLLQGEVSQKFFERVRAQAEAAGLLDDEHFTVDGTLLEAWASRDSFEPKKDPPQCGSGVRGRKLLRDLHESKTDPEARLYKKSAQGPSKPSYLGHVITENKNGLIVQSCVTEAGR